MKSVSPIENLSMPFFRRLMLPELFAPEYVSVDCSEAMKISESPTYR
jgi:hypothetical protein